MLLTLTNTGVVGKVQNKLPKEGGWRKKSRTAPPRGSSLEPGTYRVLGESLKQHATKVV